MVDKRMLVQALEDKLQEIRNSLPAHSVPAAMLIEVEDIEAQLQLLQVEQEQKNDAST